MLDIRDKFVQCYNEEQAAVLNDALDYATEMHINQKRDSGEPYIIHPIAVAKILIDLGLDYRAVSAALLHDVVEDTSATEEDVINRFGKETAELVMGVTKLQKLAFKSKEEEQAENFRRMFFAMAKDIRVLIIKIADRLHNMRTLASLSIERQQAIASETLEIFAPLASRLGLSYFKCELEDLCLKVLQPTAYEQLVNEITLKRSERTDLVSQICGRLNDMLKDLNIVGEVSGRPKHFYSIYRKMTTQNKTFEQIYDLTAVRVIVQNIKDCYEVLGMIHTVWKPIPGRFKDYIAVPKPNNYQSLHTTVMTTYGMPFEIQIRTYEMHKIAEYGIAAHWKYKENRASSDDFDEKLEWLRGVMDVQSSDNTSPQEFYESLKFDLYSGQVFVFTPKGDVVNLPEGSTPIDFAYYVHSEIGNKCTGAKINSKMVPLETKLCTGDYIEIITSNGSKGPSRDWLRIVKTSQAKSKIKAYFKRELKDENIKRGKEMLEREAKNRGLLLGNLMQPKWLDIIMQRYSISSIEDLYASVGYGGFGVNQILLKLIDFYNKEEKAKQPVKEVTGPRKSDTSGILVKGHDDLQVRISRCCNPVPGDDIVGFVSRGRGVAIHRVGCSNLKNVEPFRLIEAHWIGENASSFIVAVQVEGKDSNGMLARITTEINELDIILTSLSARVDKNNNGIVNFTIRVNKIDEFERLQKRLLQIPGVDKVFRSNH